MGTIQPSAYNASASYCAEYSYCAHIDLQKFTGLKDYIENYKIIDGKRISDRKEKFYIELLKKKSMNFSIKRCFEI